MNSQNEVFAIVLLGGVGSRFGGNTPKQYLRIGDKPLMAYPLFALEKCEDVDKIVLVSAKEYEDRAREVCSEYGIAKLIGIAPSGASREDSVLNALLYLKKLGVKDDDIVLIHDGDRPNLTETLIQKNIEAAKRVGAAVTAIKAKDSIILSQDGKRIDGYAKRSEVYHAQTPQTFRYGIIEKAMQAQGTNFTDDGSIVSSYGGQVELVEGDERNIKITTKEDASSFLAMKGETHA